MKVLNNIYQTSQKSGIILLAAMMVFSSAAVAAKKENIKWNKTQSEDLPYAYGKVINVTPLYRQIRVNKPVKECWDEPVRYPRRSHSPRNSVGDTLAGGLIGGIIGHQIGDGRGRDLATAVGTIIGAQAGQNAGRNHYDRPYYDTRDTRYRERCETHNRYSYEEVVDGYEVTYRYKGQRYQTTMPYDPGKKIKLKVTVEPAY